MPAPSPCPKLWMSQAADSAGQPWQGRHFEPNVHAADDGEAPAAFLAAVASLRDGTSTLAEVVEVVRGCRFLIPLVAVAGETGVTDDGRLVDKTQELSIITVAGPDGRPILPVFSSVSAMRHWRPDARPVPADAVRVALAAASERTDRVIVDARSEVTQLVLPRPAVWAIAQQQPWLPAVDDAEVLDALAEPATEHPEVWAVSAIAGDPLARGDGPELIVRLAVEPGLDAARVRHITAALGAAWSNNSIIAERVDSMTVELVAAASGQGEAEPSTSK